MFNWYWAFLFIYIYIISRLSVRQITNEKKKTNTRNLLKTAKNSRTIFRVFRFIFFRSIFRDSRPRPTRCKTCTCREREVNINEKEERPLLVCVFCYCKTHYFCTFENIASFNYLRQLSKATRYACYEKLYKITFIENKRFRPT